MRTRGRRRRRRGARPAGRFRDPARTVGPCRPNTRPRARTVHRGSSPSRGTSARRTRSTACCRACTFDRGPCTCPVRRRSSRDPRRSHFRSPRGASTRCRRAWALRLRPWRAPRRTPGRGSQPTTRGRRPRRPVGRARGSGNRRSNTPRPWTEGDACAPTQDIARIDAEGSWLWRRSDSSSAHDSGRRDGYTASAVRVREG